ncbi:glycosyltransferase family 39 protein [Bacteroides helcogenes]|uniref:Glycosyl transferase family 39 n=1 Tax=Bacteroides helcogenes (strain ATCC 35417 / DSM 20613 / JCM 6297 / CCUG 15421 / P 36-108) TaxID=693979 RepID=E6SQK6_BACT6|nr:glycosyltransferase family 39 protein [Bacteroides helcogenes]ADV42980.1 glycosyl transferase family 39 [Bacteroides helcogenes P 36-108]MDY5236977.1 glycosyltransferase family 39 protein [Bacteroides helcogenes]
MKRKEYIICLFVFIALLPLLVFRDFTPSNELRYLSIADEALRQGNLFAFTNHGVPYADKPPLYLWIVMLGKVLFGSHQMWFLSLFSLLPAFGCTLLMDRWAKEEISSGYRSAAMLMLMSCGMFLGTAVILRMDMLMCWFILLSLHTFYRMCHDESFAHSRGKWLFPLYVFLALFTKGPLGFLIPLISTLVYLMFAKKWRTLVIYWGWRTWCLLLGGCLLWFGMVYFEGGEAYLQNLLIHQTVDRAVNSFAHSRPFYYYLYSMWYCMMPWSLLTGGIIIASLFFKKHWQSSLSRFFLTVIGCTLVILSFISSKIDIYLIPAYPFIIYLGVISLQRMRRNGWMVCAVAIPALAFVAVLPVFCVFASMPEFSYLRHGFFYATAVILTMTGVASLYLLFRYRAMPKTLRLMSVGLFFALFVGGWGIPQINDRLGYGVLCRKSVAIAARHRIKTFGVWHLSRPENMDVYLHREVKILPSDDVLPSGLTDMILMLPQKEAEKIVHCKEKYQVGENAIVVL